MYLKCKHTVEIFRLGNKNTNKIDNTIITDDAVASCCVDKYRGNRSLGSFPNGTNNQCTAADDSSEDSSHYSDCEFSKGTVSGGVSWEDKSGEKI